MTPAAAHAGAVYYRDESLVLWQGHARRVLSELDTGSVHCAVTSPPYYALRDYGGHAEQIGHEDSPADYVAALRAVFDELRRVLAQDGTLWLNLGDCYYSGRGNPGANSADPKQPARRGWVRPVDRPGQSWAKPKDMLGIPWRVAFALQDSGWVLRNAIVWHKPNAMPEPVQDRLSCRYEMMFLLTRGPRYWFDLDPIREPLSYPDALTRDDLIYGGRKGSAGKLGASARRTGSVYGGVVPGRTRPANGGPDSDHDGTHPRGRNPGDVWEIATTPYPDAHFAAFPLTLPQRCILAGCRPGGTVLDPFCGTGTTLLAAQRCGRAAVGIDLHPDYLAMALRRCQDAPLPLAGGDA